MATIVLNNISNGQDVDAGPVQSNFNAIATAINGGLDDANIEELSLSKLLQGGAGSGNVPIWTGSAWTPTARRIATATKTTNVTVSATTAATANEVLTLGAQTYAARPVEFHFVCSRVAVPGAAGANLLSLQLWETSTRLGVLTIILNSEGAGGSEAQYPIHLVSPVITPTAGSRTYRVMGHRGSVNCTVFAGAGGADVEVPMKMWAEYV